MYCLINLLFFDIPFSYYYINLKLPLIIYLLVIDIFLLAFLCPDLLSAISELPYGELIETL